MSSPSEQEQHIRTFVKLANLTQTNVLHEWNLESLRRALQWAQAAERTVNSTENRQEVETNVRRWFPVATLPTLPLDEALTANALQHASVHLLKAILQSPFLKTHPTRVELVVEVLRELKKREAETGEESDMNSAISALLTERVVGEPRTDAMLAIARRLSGGCKPIRVKVLSGWVDVPPLKSYALSPRTLQLKAMAKTLQRNAVDARASVDPEIYRSFLNNLKCCFEDAESRDVREVVVLMLVMCEWPTEEPEQLRGMVGDLLKIVHGWVTHKPIRLWTFKPWLAAMLASKYKVLRGVYVSELFEMGLLPPWEREFAERFATLIMEDDEVEVILEPALAKLDPHLQHQYFKVK